MINSEFKLLYTDKSEVKTQSIYDFLVSSNICKSKREARDLHKQGGLSINKEKIPSDITHIAWVTNARWDIPNKLLLPYYLLTKEEYEHYKSNA